MSLYFDLVINCVLRKDAPQIAIDVIRYLTSCDVMPDKEIELFYEGVDLWPNFSDDHFLAPLPERDIISSFRRRVYPPDIKEYEIYDYYLQFSGIGILDDIFYHRHSLFIYWLATVAEEGFIGYIKEKYDAQPHLLYVKDRRLV